MTFSIINKSQLEGAKRLDAEYYQPEFLELIGNLENKKAVLIKEIIKIEEKKFTPKNGEKFDYIEISEVNLVTGEYNKNEILGEVAPSRAQYLVKNGDVLVSMVRPIRNAVSLIDENNKNLVCSSGFAVLRVKDIEPEYLFVYLKTKQMVALLDRATTATMYPAITIDDILKTKIYLGDKKFREIIKNNVVEAQKELRRAKDFYKQAERLLLEELGLTDFEKEIENLPNFSIVQLSEAKIAHRFDAEYFLPKYDILIEKLKSQNAKLLSDFATIKKGIEPGSESYQNEGKLFIRVSSVSKDGIEGKDQKYLNDELYQKLINNFEPKVGEILLSKDATPGIAYVLKEKVEGIVSGGILRLILKDKIQAEYLALCINSIVGQMQVVRDAGGSIIDHWKTDEVKNLLIPVLPLEIQQKIADLVQRSHVSRQNAKRLLEIAKRGVEMAIESGEIMAQNWIAAELKG